MNEINDNSVKVNSLNKVGELLFKEGRIESAIDSWEEALSMGPNNVEIHKNLAVAFQSQGDLEAAIYHYEIALDLLKKQ